MSVIESIKQAWIERGVKEGFKRGIEKGLKRGVKLGKKEGMNKGIEEGIARGIQEGFEKGRKDGIEIGIREGVERKSLFIAREMILNNEPIEKVIKYTGFKPEKLVSLVFME